MGGVKEVGGGQGQQFPAGVDGVHYKEQPPARGISQVESSERWARVFNRFDYGLVFSPGFGKLPPGNFGIGNNYVHIKVKIYVWLEKRIAGLELHGESARSWEKVSTDIKKIAGAALLATIALMLFAWLVPVQPVITLLSAAIFTAVVACLAHVVTTVYADYVNENPLPLQNIKQAIAERQAGISSGVAARATEIHTEQAHQHTA